MPCIGLRRTCCGRVTHFQDPLEGNRRTFGDATDRRLGTLEAAQDHLVVTHEQRPEIAHGFPTR